MEIVFPPILCEGESWDDAYNYKLQIANFLMFKFEKITELTNVGIQQLYILYDNS